MYLKLNRAILGELGLTFNYRPLFFVLWLPLLETFGIFCWGKPIEELRNIHKLKELITLPIGVPNNV